MTHESRVWTHPDLPGVTFLRAALGSHAFPPHRHDAYVFGVSERGVYGTWRRGRELVLDEDHVAVVEPDETHTARGPAHGPWVWRALYVPATALAGKTAALFPTGSLHDLHDSGKTAASFSRLARPALRDGKTAASFRRLHRAFESGTGDPEELGRWLRGVLAELESPRPAGDRAVPDAVLRTQRLLERRADEPLALEDLVREAGWSPGHLIKEFRRGLGLTPHAYLLQVRVERARRRIAGGASLVDVALASGFADQSHLNRHFKRVLGVTPGVFARGVRDAEPQPASSRAARTRRPSS